VLLANCVVQCDWIVKVPGSDTVRCEAVIVAVVAVVTSVVVITTVMFD